MEAIDLDGGGPTTDADLVTPAAAPLIGDADILGASVVPLVALGLLSRSLLSAAAVLHYQANNRAHVQMQVAQRAGKAVVTGEARGPLTMQARYWIAAALCAAADGAAGLTVILGGALILPLLGAPGAAFDALARWLVLSDPRPRGRVAGGMVLAVISCLLLACSLPPPHAWSAERLWLALQQPLLFAVLVALAGGITVTEVGSLLAWRTYDQADVLAVQSASWGVLGLLAGAALCSFARHERQAVNRPPFASPLGLQLIAAALLCTVLQAMRLGSAFRRGDQPRVSRSHAISFTLVGSTSTALLFAADPIHPSISAPHVGFPSTVHLTAYIAAVAFGCASLVMLHKVQQLQPLGPMRLEGAVTDSDRAANVMAGKPFPKAEWRGRVRAVAQFDPGPHPGFQPAVWTQYAPLEHDDPSAWRYVARVQEEMRQREGAMLRGESVAGGLRRGYVSRASTGDARFPREVDLARFQTGAMLLCAVLLLVFYTAAHMACTSHGVEVSSDRSCSVSMDELVLVGTVYASLASVINELLWRWHKVVRGEAEPCTDFDPRDPFPALNKYGCPPSAGEEEELELRRRLFKALPSDMQDEARMKAEPGAQWRPGVIKSPAKRLVHPASQSSAAQQRQCRQENRWQGGVCQGQGATRYPASRAAEGSVPLRRVPRPHGDRRRQQGPRRGGDSVAESEIDDSLNA